MHHQVCCVDGPVYSLFAQVHSLLRGWLVGVYQMYKKSNLPAAWDVDDTSPRVAVPQQANFSDCGVFMILCTSWYIMHYFVFLNCLEFDNCLKCDFKITTTCRSKIFHNLSVVIVGINHSKQSKFCRNIHQGYELKSIYTLLQYFSEQTLRLCTKSYGARAPMDCSGDIIFLKNVIMS